MNKSLEGIYAALKTAVLNIKHLYFDKQSNDADVEAKGGDSKQSIICENPEHNMAELTKAGHVEKELKHNVCARYFLRKHLYFDKQSNDADVEAKGGDSEQSIICENPEHNMAELTKAGHVEKELKHNVCARYFLRIMEYARMHQEVVAERSNDAEMQTHYQNPTMRRYILQFINYFLDIKQKTGASISQGSTDKEIEPKKNSSERNDDDIFIPKGKPKVGACVVASSLIIVAGFY